MSVATKYCGPLADHTGYGEANRQDVAALYIAGIDTTVELVVQVAERTSLGWQGELAYGLRDRKIPYKIKIIHLTPDLYENYLEKDVYHIGRLMWETDRLPADWAKYCNKMGEIWATSPHMVELFKKSGVRVPIYHFPQPIGISMADRDWGRYVIPQHKGFLFYSILQWIERKNPKALLRAYWEEFSGNENVSLLLKTFRLSYDSGEIEKIRDDIRGWKMEMGIVKPPRVLLCTKLLNQNDIMKLHNTGDAFVLGHRGEGWSRPIQEALLIGKPVIATARGGIHEYLRDEHYFGVESEYVPVTEVPWIKFYTKDQMWAEVDHMKLRKNMRFVYDNYEEAKSKGIVAKEYIKNSFSYHLVGYAMKERLEKISKSLWLK